MRARWAWWEHPLLLLLLADCCQPLTALACCCCYWLREPAEHYWKLEVRAKAVGRGARRGSGGSRRAPYPRPTVAAAYRCNVRGSTAAWLWEACSPLQANRAVLQHVGPRLPNGSAPAPVSSR